MELRRRRRAEEEFLPSKKAMPHASAPSTFGALPYFAILTVIYGILVRLIVLQSLH